MLFFLRFKRFSQKKTYRRKKQLPPRESEIWGRGFVDPLKSSLLTKHEKNTIPPCLILLETMKVKNPSAKTMLTKSILFQINI